MIRIKIRHNRYRWKAPAAANFFFGGLGAGLFIMVWLAVLGHADRIDPATQGNIDLISAFLVALGFLAVSVEAGRPKRGIYVFLNFATAWMSREMIAGWIFILLCVIQYFSQSAFPGLLAVLCAVFFIFSQSMVLYRSLAIANWQTYLIPVLIISADLCTGFGTALLLGMSTTPLLVLGIVFMGLHIFIAVLYSLRMGTEATPLNGVQPTVFKVLMRKDIAILVLALMMSCLLLLAPIRDSALMTAVCGILITFGVAYKIYSIVCKSVSLRQMTIEKPIPKSFS